METLVKGTKKEVLIGPGRPMVVIGNLIDPAAGEDMAAAIKGLDMGPLEDAAKKQARDGADLISVKVEMDGVDEVAALPRAVKAVAQAVDLPLCLTTRDVKALKAALEVCPGKPLVNAATAQEGSMMEVLPLVLAYSAAVITLGYSDVGLPYEFQGLPFKFDVPFEHHRIVLRKALATGIPRQDIVIGVSSPAIADDPSGAAKALELVRSLSRMEQLSVALDPGSITRSQADQGVLDQVLAVATMACGVNCVFGDPAVMRKLADAADLLLYPQKSGGS